MLCYPKGLIPVRYEGLFAEEYDGLPLPYRSGSLRPSTDLLAPLGAHHRRLEVELREPFSCFIRGSQTGTGPLSYS